LIKKNNRYRANYILGFISVSAILLCNIACNKTKENIEPTIINDNVSSVEENTDFQTEEDLLNEDVETVTSSSDESNVPSVESDIESAEKDQIIKIYSYYDVIDQKNEEDLLNSMRTVVNDSSEEDAFTARFIENPEGATFVDNSVYEMIKTESEEGSSIVFLIKEKEAEYPKIAYGLHFDESKSYDEALLEAENEGDLFEGISALDHSEYSKIDFLKPLTDYQDVTFIRNESDKLVKAEYSSDSQKYGTYNSEGVLYYDESERPILKEYYTTSGTRYMAYVYDEDKLVMICDFGGMAYMTLESNNDIEIGMNYSVYLIP